MKYRIILVGCLSLAFVSAGWADETQLRRRLQQLKASDTDEWRKIPWARSLLDAAETARRENRLTFTFTHEGNIDTGRC